MARLQPIHRRRVFREVTPLAGAPSIPRQAWGAAAPRSEGSPCPSWDSKEVEERASQGDPLRKERSRRRNSSKTCLDCSGTGEETDVTGAEWRQHSG